MHDSVVLQGSSIDISFAPRRGAQMGLPYKASCIISLSEQTGKERRLANVDTLKLCQFDTKTATCTPVVPHSLQHARLNHLLVTSVGALVVYGNTAGHSTSKNMLKGWRRVLTVCSHLFFL